MQISGGFTAGPLSRIQDSRMRMRGSGLCKRLTCRLKGTFPPCRNELLGLIMPTRGSRSCLKEVRGFGFAKETEFRV